ncbi:MAG TPA: hypothetical protein VMZ52_06420 [Bryobacteraceae bacterium]|nr:hypothetical protein [Bryobacteraceae bacterium]
MERRVFLVVLLLGAACSRAKEESLSKVLPVQVQRSWVLKETRNLGMDDAPPLIRSLGLKRALAAVYKTNTEIRLRVFEMGAETSSFEVMQKWRQADGAAFYKGPYFVVIETTNTDPESLKEFVKALQVELGPGAGIR